MKLDSDPREQREQGDTSTSTSASVRRSSRRKGQESLARATTIAFSSEQWDEMVAAGWSVNGCALLVGAGYVLAPWRQNYDIREIKGLTEGKDSGFWV